MKLKRIYFKPKASLELNPDEIGLLARCAAAHYDGVCKDTIKQGGIICGLQNWSLICPGKPHDLTWREIDTLAKVLEVGTHINEGAPALSLNVALRQVLSTLNASIPDPIEFD